MRDIGHSSLEGVSNVSETEIHDVVCKGAPWCGESGFVLIDMGYLCYHTICTLIEEKVKESKLA
jgi:hypothetical protein